ncbi:MAG: tungstate transport system substrate-binding protein [Solirubrobacteraceae bacterium]|jgi:ABC-type tungstate transport system permease subunit|nr:tungstate transport system substrate-binding protein [Solirubrobacteraceae bacterium]
MRKRKLRKVSTAFGVALVATGALAGEAQAVTIKIFGTSDLFDSNLYQSKMQTLYNATSPFFVAGDTLSYTSVGSGKALTSAQNGYADLVLVHSAPLEKNFVTGGYSYEPLGRSLLYNDYVVVGPPSDPAGVAANAAHDGVKAYTRIAQRGDSNGDVTFVSRDDASGTNVQEETMWGQTGLTKVQAAQNRGSVQNLFQPAVAAGSTAYPAWYVRQKAGSGFQTQGANLISTSTCAAAFAPDGGCYTMTDRGTLAYQQSQGQATGLTILSQNNAIGTTGGVTELINPFHAYIVTPINPKPGSGGVYPSGLVPNVTAATRFVNFLTGATGASGATGHQTYTPEFQNELSTYLSPGIFHPDAFPQLIAPVPTPSGSPHTVAAGSAQAVSAKVIYAPTSPAGGSPITSIPYKINMSTDGGTTWTTVTTGVFAGSLSSATGAVKATATMPATHGTTVKLQLSTPVFDDSADGFATRFSPYENNVDLGSFITS